MKNSIFGMVRCEDDEYKKKVVLGNNQWTIADTLNAVTIQNKITF